MSDFAWFNLGGTWFKVHGDPGTTEARELMRKAISDLSISKAQNINDLEIIDVNRLPFYRIQSHFEKDIIELWPQAYKREKKRRLELEIQKREKEIIPKFLIAFEAYNSTGQQVGYVICTDGKLGGYEFAATNNVINPHPVYPFSLAHWIHHEYAPDGYSEWGEWFLAQQAVSAETGVNLVYPFHFPDWKWCTGWADEGSYYRGYEDPDQYVPLANPYPLAEVPYPHGTVPPDKFLFTRVEDGILRQYYDVSQDTKFEEKLMDWFEELYPYQMGMEGADRAFTSYVEDTQESPGEEIQIHCEFYDPRYGANGQIRGVKRHNHVINEEYLGALTGITVTTPGKANKLFTTGIETPIYTYFDQWAYPWIDALRYYGDSEYTDNQDGVQYRTVADANAEYEYNEILTYDNFASIENLGYDTSVYLWEELLYGWEHYLVTVEEDADTYSIITSVAASSLQYAALVQRQQSYSLSYTDYSLTSKACGKNFSPNYYAGIPDVDKSACAGSSNNGSDSLDDYESFLIVNGQKVESFGDEYLGHGFIRWWENPGWIVVNVSFASEFFYTGEEENFINVKYQLWNSATLSKIAEVEFDPIIPSEGFFAGLDRWEEGYKCNWHNIPSGDGFITGPDGQPIICSGHFRCFKVLEVSEETIQTERIDLGEIPDD